MIIGKLSWDLKLLPIVCEKGFYFKRSNCTIAGILGLTLLGDHSRPGIHPQGKWGYRINLGELKWTVSFVRL
jgi:hypothetical protein